MSQVTISSGRRMSTTRCKLDPIRTRPSLHIETDARAQALMLEGIRCVGVRYAVRGIGLVQQAMRYAFLRDGLLGAVAAPIRAFVRSREGLAAPDVLFG